VRNSSRSVDSSFESGCNFVSAALSSLASLVTKLCALTKYARKDKQRRMSSNWFAMSCCLVAQRALGVTAGASVAASLSGAALSTVLDFAPTFECAGGGSSCVLPFAMYAVGWLGGAAFCSLVVVLLRDLASSLPSVLAEHHWLLPDTAAGILTSMSLGSAHARFRRSDRILEVAGA
jgi:hypothetical protein